MVVRPPALDKEVCVQLLITIKHVGRPWTVFVSMTLPCQRSSKSQTALLKLPDRPPDAT